MSVFCCCTGNRSAKTPSWAFRDQDLSSTLPPLTRPPGPLSMNPIMPTLVGFASISPTSHSSAHPSITAGIGPIDPVELGQLVIEDSDTDDEIESRPHNKSTSTLQLVRTHIKRHLSQDSLPRRKARSAVGTSQEEIERRAELKRLMHKRIREELRSESRDTTLGDVDSSPSRRSPSADFLPGGGPRDNLEFSVTEDSKVDTQDTSNSESEGLTPARKETSEEECSPGPRRASCPDPLPKPISQSIGRERSSLPEMPLSSDPYPKSPPSTHETSSIGSWRLSYSAGQLDELLGYPERGRVSRDDSSIQQSFPPVIGGSVGSPILRMPFSGPSRSFSRSHSPIRQGTPECETASAMDHSPLSTWLRSQGLQSDSPSVSCLRASEDDQEPSIEEAEVVYIRRCSSVQNQTLAEIEHPRPDIVHLYDMDIHRQLSTEAFNTPDESTVNSAPRRDSTRKAASGQHSSSGTGSQLMGSTRTSGSVQATRSGCGKNYLAWPATVASSVYPSRANSVDPNPGTPNSQFLSWTAKGQYKLTTAGHSCKSQALGPFYPTC